MGNGVLNEEKINPTITHERPTGPRISLAPKPSLGQLALARGSRIVGFCKSSVRNKMAIGIVASVVLSMAVDLSTSVAINGLHISAMMLPAASNGKKNLGLPCDIIICAEAYSVTRALTKNYAGPLFQLNKPPFETLDIGQVNGVVDLSTWSAFCGGMAANCYYSKIYSQVSSDDLVSNSATWFKIEAATGLPIIQTAADNEDIGKMTLANDGIASAIIGGSHDASVIYNGRTVDSPFCCGMFGFSHRYDAEKVPGSDFLFTLGKNTYGNGYHVPPDVCPNNGTYCIGIDEENGSNPFAGGTIGSSAINVIGIIDRESDRTRHVYANGNLIYSDKLSFAPNTPTSIHLGGGGDLSTPAPALMREGIIVNSLVSDVDRAKIFNEMKSFYSGLSFP